MWAVAVSTALSVAGMCGASLIPYFILRKSNSSSGIRYFSSGLIAFCNCFACGVFLATCFLGLIPHTRMSEDALQLALRSAGTNVTTFSSLALNKTLASTELMVLLGILLMLLIEQIFTTCYFQAAGTHFALDVPGDHCSESITPFNDAFYSKRSTKSANSMSSFCAPSNEHCRNTKNAANKLNRGDNEKADPKRSRGDFEPLVNLDDMLDDMSTDEELAKDENDDELGNIEFRVCSDNSRPKFSFGRNNDQSNNRSNILQTVMLLLAMSTHSVFEGIALNAQQTVDHFLRLLFSVMLHEILCCFSYGISLSSQSVSPRTAVLSTLFLALSIPAGMLIMSVVGSLDGLSAMMTKFLLEGLSAGIFIYVACVEILAPEFGGHAHSHGQTSHSPKGGIVKAIMVCLGALVAFFFGVSVHKSK